MIKTSMYYFSRASVLLFFLITGNLGMAQQQNAVPKNGKINALKQTIKGVVVDHATGKPLSGINVKFGNVAADLSDEKGAFTISVPTLDVELQAEGEGYEKKQIAVKGRTTLTIAMTNATGKSFQQDAFLEHEKSPLRNLTAAVRFLKGVFSCSRKASC